MVEEKKERRKEEKKEREERVGGESVPCTSTAAEASDRRPSWTCTSAAQCGVTPETGPSPESNSISPRGEYLSSSAPVTGTRGLGSAYRPAPRLAFAQKGRRMLIKEGVF